MTNTTESRPPLKVRSTEEGTRWDLGCVVALWVFGYLATRYPTVLAPGYVITTLMVWPPCILAFLHVLELGSFGLKLPSANSWLTASAATVVAFSAYSAGVLAFADWPPIAAIDAAFWSFLLGQTLLVALPEEFFFRGFLQGQFVQRAPSRPILAVVLAALAFALTHVIIHESIGLLRVFFPGILFGWLRYRTKSIWPAVLAHGLANGLHALLPAPW